MSDRTLRDLERRASTGDVEASAELLLHRHRLGRLPEERLRLACHLGHPGALLAGRRLLNVAPRRQNLGSWVRTIGQPTLGTWPRELPWIPLVRPVCARVAVAAAELGLPVWSSRAWAKGVGDRADADTALLARVLAETQAWLGAPDPEAARQLWNMTARSRLSGVPTSVAMELVSVVCQPVPPAARSQHARERETARSTARVVESAARALAWELGDKVAAETQVRDAIRARALPWLLES